jgi:hypothetical protein
MLLLRSGLLLACIAVLLQVAVYLQPLLPEKYHIAPVCFSITHNLIAPIAHDVHSSSHHSGSDHPALDLTGLKSYFSYHHEHVHDLHNHQCQYCTVYGDIVMPPDFGIQEVINRIHVRLSIFIKLFKHVYFELQRLFLMPQGRAPPFSL